MKNFQAWAAMACVVGCALAQPVLAKGFTDGYVTAMSSFDGSLSTFDVDESGTGFGLRGVYEIGSEWSAVGEYSSTNYDNLAEDLVQFRIGAGKLDENGAGFYFEYVNLDADIETLSGPGVHVRLRTDTSKNSWIHGGFGALYLNGKESNSDQPAMELNLGGGYKFQKNLAVFADLRNTWITGEQNDGDLRGALLDLRAGVRLHF